MKPTITVITRTNGSNRSMLNESVQSYLNQDYPFKQLLIVNTHPTPLRMETETDGVTILNLVDIWDHLADQMIDIMAYVHTDAWTILDDDDLILSWHLSKLASLWRVHGGSKSRVAIGRLLVYFGNRPNGNTLVESWDHPHWGSCLFPALTSGELKAIYHNLPRQDFYAEDKWLVSNTCWDNKYTDRSAWPSYVWRRYWPGQTHTCPTYGEKFDPWINFWHNKAKAYSQPIDPVIRPGWQKDYEKSFCENALCKL